MSSKIEWCDETWNPVIGCTPISEGCKNCYAQRMAYRLACMGQVPYMTGVVRGEGVADPARKKTPLHGTWTGQTHFIEPVLNKPLHWRKPRRIFVCSMGDLFHNDVSFDDIDKIMAVIAVSRKHTFMMLTKRPKRMREYFAERPFGEALATVRAIDDSIRAFTAAPEWVRAVISRYQVDDVFSGTREGALGYHSPEIPPMFPQSWPLPNLWLGVTAENQEAANERIPILLDTPAAKRFVSIEPMLGPVDLDGTPAGQALGECCHCGSTKSNPDCEACMGIPSLDWVICGGESGPGARPMNLNWARQLRDDCVESETAFMFKQWGQWKGVTRDAKARVRHKADTHWHNWPDEGDESPVSIKCDKKKAGRLLDGKEWLQMPEGVTA